MESSRGLGALGIAALALVCCAALPLLVAAGSVVAVARIGGLGLGAVALGAAVVLLALRVRRRRSAACCPLEQRPREEL